MLGFVSANKFLASKLCNVKNEIRQSAFDINIEQINDYGEESSV